MAKGSKKRKEKKKDFQKVKLKVGKKIPKSLNATETAFKSRAIQLKKQLGKDFKGPETKRKLNIQELLSHLQHYNVNVRLDGASGLRELLSHHPKLIHENLSVLVGSIAAAFIDRTPAIRKAVVALIQIIATHVYSEEILPFFPILSAHLGCAMTHINDEIRIDALKILDIYLEKYPELVNTSSHQILEKFLSLISQKGTEYKSESGTTPNSLRTLTVNPSSKLSRQKWRMAVLLRMGKFLKVLTNTAKPKDGSSCEKSLIWGNGHYNVTTFLYGGTEPYNESCFKLRRGSASYNTKSDKGQRTDGGVLFIDALIPLLFDCWTETISSQDGSNVSPDSASMMCIMTDVMLHIVSYLKQLTKDSDSEGDLWMKAEQQRHISQIFFARFPYVVHGNLNKIQRKKKFKVVPNEETREKVSSMRLNTAVAELMCLLLDPQLGHTLDRQLLKRKLCMFLSKALLNGQNGEDGDLKRTLGVVELFIKLPLEDGIVQEISSAAYNCLSKCQACLASKQHILEVFCSLQLSNCFLQIDKTHSWLTLLPKTVTSSSLKCEHLNTLLSLMHRAAAQEDEKFLSALLIELPHFIDKLPKFNSSQRKTIFELLHFAPRAENELYTKLTEWSRSEAADVPAIKYMLHILHSRFIQQLKYGEWTKTEHYINWLISMLIGCNTSEFPPNNPNLCDIQKWPFENVISQSIASCVRQLPNELQVQDLISEQIRCLLGNCSHTPLVTQLGVIQFFSSLPSLNDVNLLFMGRVCSEALAALVGMDYNSANDKHICSSALEVCWRLCVKFKMTEHILNKLLDGILEMKTMSDMERFVVASTKLLQNCEAGVLLHHQYSSFISNIEERFTNSALKNSQWWTDYKYEIQQHTEKCTN